jgi:micrococcal nuclease
MKRSTTLLFVLILVAILGYGCDSDNDATGPGAEPTSGPYTTRTATVTSVIDGDTVWVNGSEKVRYIGIDTPETNECYYQEAKDRNRDLVGGKTVTLEVCVAAPTDQYGRTLAHIHVDGTLVNKVLLTEGFARAYNVPPCTTRADEYRNAMNEAFNAGAGMWSACY